MSERHVRMPVQTRQPETLEALSIRPASGQLAGRLTFSGRGRTDRYDQHMKVERHSDSDDERFAIEGDPEDALRGLLGGGAGRYEVRLNVGERGQDVPPATTGEGITAPGTRPSIWTGDATDRADALEQALAAFEAEYGDRPAAHQAYIRPIAADE